MDELEFKNWCIIKDYFSDSIAEIYSTKEVIEAFLVTNPKMYLSNTDYDKWKSFTDYVEVYRGCNEEELEELGVPLGISYTLSPKVAEWFAERRENGCVVKATVPKECIKCFYNGRKEEEVIILDFPCYYEKCEVKRK